MNRLLDMIFGATVTLVVANLMALVGIIEIRPSRPMPADCAPLNMHPLFIPCDRPPPPELPMEGTH